MRPSDYVQRASNVGIPFARSFLLVTLPPHC
jgi:hypothetical protein